MRLLDAFLNGKRVNPRFTPWNDSQPILRMSKSTYDDLSADVFMAILRTLPHQEDEKERMTIAQSMRDEVMSVVGNKLS